MDRLLTTIMKNFILVLCVVSFLCPENTIEANNFLSRSLDKSSSPELLIAWKPGVSNEQRDEMVSNLGGRLKHRFTIVKADSVVFNSDSEFQSALTALATHSSVKDVELVEHCKCGGSASLPDAHTFRAGKLA